LTEGELKTGSDETYRRLFNEFLASSHTFRVYRNEKLIFSSDKGQLLPLVEYIDQAAPHLPTVTMFDKIFGNAAALLAIKANCREALSPLGSQLAVKTLDKYGIKYHFSQVVPFIQKPGEEEICPMEKLSIDMGPEDFHATIKAEIK